MSNLVSVAAYGEESEHSYPIAQIAILSPPLIFSDTLISLVVCVG